METQACVISAVQIATRRLAALILYKIRPITLTCTHLRTGAIYRRHFHSSRRRTILCKCTNNLTES